jgi:tetratricopeptide (TPR) repeat protein/tRNA A-37 threonylcarbamoyl transferase component Bud32
MADTPRPGPDADRNLLFGVLCLQADLIDGARFAEACSAWAGRKEVHLADLLVERGWISASDRMHVEYLLEVKLRKHGDARQSLGAVADAGVRDLIRDAQDPDFRETLTHLPPAPNYVMVTTTDAPLETRDRYTLTRLHGEGGLGRVYVAHDHQLNRDVALKELHPEKARHPEVWQRFLKEAQLTGQLEHPNIVPVYEVARREGDASPFYTMRFVRGRTLREAIADYHRRRREGREDPLDRPRLLQAFVSICQAIGYAHSRGVVHRDLKPANVMLGGFGEVIVLDWGIAKMVDRPEGAEEFPEVSVTAEARGDATLAGRVLGTPAYAAPEQAEGRIDLLDPRTDTYGLGTILYEILTGRPPHEGATTVEVLQNILARETPRARAADPSVPRALDAVCAKAMAKARPDRYAKASELAEEVQRFLADAPVRAYREPFAARAGRWARRHRSLVAGAAAVLLVGFVSIVIVAFLLEGARERTEKERAEAERQRARAEAALLEKDAESRRAERNFKKARQAVDDYFTRISENRLLGMPHLEPLRKELLESARKYYEEFAAEAAGDPKVRGDFATAVFRVATLAELIGTKQEAHDQYRRAIELYEQTLAHGDATPTDRRRLGTCLNDYSLSLMESASLDEAARALARSKEILTAVVAEQPGDVLHRAALGKTALNSALLRYKTGDTAGALREYEECRLIQEEVVRDAPGKSEYESDLSLTIMNLGSLYLETGRPEKAEELYKHTLKTQERLVKAHPEAIYYRRLMAAVHHNLGMHYRLNMEFDKARPHYEQSLKTRQRLYDEHPTVIDYQNDLGETLNNVGEIDLADRDAEKALENLRRAREVIRMIAEGQPDNAKLRNALALAHNNVGVVLHQLEQHDAALAEHGKALELREDLVRAAPTVTDYQAHLADTHSNLGNTLRSTGKLDEALRHYRTSAELYEQLIARNPAITKHRTNLALALANEGYLHEEAERWEEARAAYEQSLAVREKLLDVNPASPRFRADAALAHMYLGRALTSLGFPRRRTQIGVLLAAAPAGPLPAGACLFLKPDECAPHHNEAAQAHYDEALRAQLRLVAEYPNVPDYRADLGRTYIQYGNLLRDGKKLFDAFNWTKKAVEAWKVVLAAKPWVAEFRSNLAVAHANFGGTLQDLRLALAALSAHQAGLALREELVREHPEDVKLIRNLAESWNSVGIAQLSLRRRPLALRSFENASGLFEGAICRDPDDAKTISDFSRTLLNRAITFTESGEYADALPTLDAALPLQRDAMRRHPGKDRYAELTGMIYHRYAIVYRHLGRLGESLAAVRENLELRRHHAATLAESAADLAALAELVGKGAGPLTEREEGERACYAEEALALFREAVARGYRDAQKLRTHKDYEALRGIREFAAIVRAIEGPP